MHNAVFKAKLVVAFSSCRRQCDGRGCVMPTVLGSLGMGVV